MSARTPFLFVIIMLTACVGCQKNVQVTGGMAPTIKAGESVSINYLAYLGSAPQRWDVVAVKVPPSIVATNTFLVKRVVGLPGETISLTASGIVINGKPMSMPPALSNVVYCPTEKLPESQRSILVTFPYAIPPKQYFVVGDNWTNSLDSRHYGAVPLTDIIGRVAGK